MRDATIGGVTSRRSPSGVWLVYDGDCGFCRYTVGYARALTATQAIEYVPYQTVADEYPEFTEEDFAASIILFGSGGVAKGAEAAFRVLAIGGRGGWLRAYRRLPPFAALCEWLYRWVAQHRRLCLRLARPLFGREARPVSFAFTGDLVYRGIALCALLAFASLWWQAEALIGERGVLPFGEYLSAIQDGLGVAGYWRVPTVLWLGIPMQAVFAFGAACALVALAGRLRVLAAIGAYVAWLSVIGVGQTFTAYQWDTFLAECLFAAAILARSPVAGIWVLRLLALRFMFLSGAVKLLSGDASWADLTALNYHFETQPLPTLLAWYAHHLPEALLASAVVATFVVELALPALVFAPRRARALAAAGFIALELLILATGNYNFFNLLTIIVCLALLDDGFLRRAGTPRERPRRRLGARWLATLLIALGLCQTAAAFVRFPNPASLVEPLRIVNRYGLFAVMTTVRRELVIEGTRDGTTWHEYEFPFKPGDTRRAPRWAAPHQPRLDWQMWFAALTVPQRAPWVYGLVYRLLDAESAVLEGLDDPFNGEQPLAVRIVSYRYGFAPRQSDADGWWVRSEPRLWLPPVRRRTPTVTHEPLTLP